LESALERQRRLYKEEQEQAARRAEALRKAASPEMISAIRGEAAPAEAPVPGSNLTAPTRVLLLVTITAAACAIYFWMFALR
jgi:hypothetical protein